METIQIAIELPRNILSSMKQDPSGFVQEIRLAAAIKWYEMHRVSQSKAAEIAGISRVEFLTVLSEFQVSLFQYSDSEIIQEVSSE